MEQRPAAAAPAAPAVRARVHRISATVVCLALFSAPFSSTARGQQAVSPAAPQVSVRPQARIAPAPNLSQRVTMHGSVSHLASTGVDLGKLPDNAPIDGMQLVLTPSTDQQAALEQLLADQQNPGSANFHQWLTPRQFGQYFGAAQSDIDQITSWLQSQGLAVKGVAPGRQRIEFSGTAAQVEAAFGTELHRVTVNGEEHFANVQEVSIPAAFAAVVAGVAKLDDSRSLPKIQMALQTAGPLAGSPSPLNTGSVAVPMIFNGAASTYDVLPADYRSLYNVPGNANGSGIRIGIIEVSDPTGGLTNNGTDNTDYEQFSAVFGLNSGHLTVVLPAGDPGVGTGTDPVESSLDIQWAHALAPGAQIVVAISTGTSSNDGIDISADYLVDNNLVDIISTSYGNYYTSDTYNQYVTQRAEQASAQGISFVSGSGDWGSGSSTESILSADVTTSNPYTTSVGGSNIDAGSNAVYWWGANIANYTQSTLGGHIPEDAWNGSGGGSDPRFAKPDWQVGVTGIPNDGYRDFPDVSLLAGPTATYLICENGGCSSKTAPLFSRVYGTSASGPAFAGMVALLDQQNGGRQGLLNRSLYKLGASENWSGCNGSSQSTTRPPGSCVFYDITVGSNAVSGQADYGTGSQTYNTNTGYDLVTGLGSVNLSQLVSAWGTVSYLPTTVSLALPSTSFYGELVSFSGTVRSSAGGTPTGFITLTTPTQSFGPYALDGSGNYSGTVQGLAVGNDTVTANYGGDAQYASAKSAGQPIQVSKISSTVSVTFNTPSPSAFGTATRTAIIDVGGTTGYGRPTGNVHVYYNAASQGSSFQDLGISSLGQDANNSSLAELDFELLLYTYPPDTYTFKVDYLGDSIFNASTTSGIGTMVVSKATSTVAVGASTNAAANGANVTLTASLTMQEFAATPTGTVQFYQNGLALGSPVALSNVAGGGVNFTTGTGTPYTATATLNTTALLPGADAVTAVYSGDSNINGSNSNTQSVAITGYSTTVSLSASQTSNIFSGAAIFLTANIFSAQTSPALSGTVTYYVNGVNVGSQSVSSGTNGGNQDATAVLLTGALPVGTDTIVAVYNGDTHYNPGTSYSINVTVIPTVESGFVSPANVDFGTVSVGSSSAATNVFFTSNGTADIPLSGITITGANASSFTQVEHCPSLIPDNSTCYTAVTFTPQTSGSLSATLTFEENSAGGPHTVPLTGNALPGGAYTSLSAVSLDFGDQTVTTDSPAKTLKLSNIGNATMTGISFALSAGSGNFVLNAGGCGTSLGAGASCTVSVDFTPSTTGTLTGSISENDSSHTGATPIALTGNGIPIQAITLAGALHQVGATLSSPYDALSDNLGNIYISDTAANKVYKIDAQGMQTTLPIVGLIAPMGMTMDASGNLYVVSNGGTHQVSVIKYTSPSSQTAYPFDGANGGAGVAVDSGGNIYLADPSSGSVWVCSVTCNGAVQLNVLPATAPTGIAIDSGNNLYVSSGVGGSGVVIEKPGITGAATTLTTLNTPVALSAAADGSLYIGDQHNNTVYRYAGGTTTAVLSNAAITQLTGVHVDNASNLYVVSRSNAEVLKVTANAEQLDLGYAAVGSTRPVTFTVNVPPGNSVSTITVGDLAGNTEWSLPNGNTCNVVANACSFTLNFTPAYPGLRDGTLVIKDSQSNTLSYFLYGAGQGPEAVLLNGAKTTIAGTWVPTAIDSDSAGNVYVLDSTVSFAPVVQKITPAGGVSTAAHASGGGAATDIGIEADGTIMVRTDGGFLEVNGNAPLPAAGGGRGQFALNASGAFYFNIAGTLLNANTGLPLGSATNVGAMALDADNNVYAASSDPAIYKIAPDGTTTKLLDSSTQVGNYLLQNPTGIAVDAGGAVWVADAAASAVFRIDATGSATAVGLDFSSPNGIGLALTPQGVLYLSDLTANAVYRYAPDSTSLAFGSQADQSSSPAQSVLLTNAGNLPLALSNLTMPAAYSEQYNETWCAGGGTLAASGNCNLTLVFNPQSLGAQNGSVTFTDNSLNNSAATQTVTLTGSSIVGAESALQFTTTPAASINANGNLGTVAVQVLDAAGNRVTTATDALTLTVNGPATYTFNASLVNGVATFNLAGTPIPQAGSYTITVGTTASSSVTATTPAIVTVNSLSQTISFTGPANQMYGVAPIALGGAASSGLAVTYIVSGPATLSGSTLNINGIGTVTVTAQQAGNGSYTAASNVPQSFNVSPATLTVTPTNISKNFGAPDPPLTYAITGYVNGDAVEFPVVSGIPALSTSVTTLTPVGSYPIAAALGTLTAANYTFQFAAGTLTVANNAPQTIVFDPLPDLPVRAASYRLTAFSTSGLPVSYTVTGPASVTGSQLTVTGTGSVTVTAAQAGNGSYTAATSVQQSFTAQ